MERSYQLCNSVYIDLDYEQSLVLLEHLPTDDVVTQDRIKEIKPELLNNIAVMHQKVGNLNDAENYYSLAIKESESSAGTEKNLKLTMSYNLARLYEERLETEKAVSIYKKLVEDYPGYTDGKIARGMHSFDPSRLTFSLCAQLIWDWAR